MPRPRVHHTPEEKKAANRAKSNHHYAKHKPEIQVRRRSAYWGKWPCLPLGPVVHASPMATKNPSECSNQLASYLWQTKSIHKELSVITEHSPRSYVESIYTKYMASVDENLINTAITTAGKFRDHLHDCENGVLQLAGIRNELMEVHSALHDVNMIIGWLEELYCYVMSDVAELVDMHASQKLMYQA